MTWQFKKHYTRDQARELLPDIRKWLERLTLLRNNLQTSENRISQMLASHQDIGGETVNNWIKTLCALKGVLHEFESREIQIKDINRGLIDFPAIIGGREVFLCWESDEDDIEFWHDLDSGFAGREPLD